MENLITEQSMSTVIVDTGRLRPGHRVLLHPPADPPGMVHDLGVFLGITLTVFRRNSTSPPCLRAPTLWEFSAPHPMGGF